MKNYLKGQVGDKIAFETQTAECGGREHRAMGTIVAVYPKYFLVQTPFGYKATVSRFVLAKDEREN